MKARKTISNETLEQALGLFSSPSLAQVESAGGRVFKRLEADRFDGTGRNESFEFVAARPIGFYWRSIVLASLALLIAALGFVPIWKVQKGSWLPDSSAILETAGKGRSIRYGESVRSKDDAVLTLADSSRVELRSGTEVLLERAADGIRIRLNNGGIIINAAKQDARHLYVQTKDLAVSVVGTVFFVNMEADGSRVGVIEGKVQVEHAGSAERLLPGEQVATNALMESKPVGEEIAWSLHAKEHLALLQQSVAPTASSSSESPDLFEVASIRPSGPEPDRGRGGGPPRLPSGQGPCPGSSLGSLQLQFQLDPGRIVIRRISGYYLIALAYGNRCPAAGFISGGPDWVDSERFDIQATVPAGTPAYTKEQLLGGNAPKLERMLQALLADRFKLVLRRDIKEMPAYDLVVAKPGKLKLSEDQSPDSLPNTATTALAPLPVATMPSRSAPISRFASNLQQLLKMPVIDKTGLTGLYDIVLSFPELGTLPAPSQDSDPAEVLKRMQEMSSRIRDRLPDKLEQETGLKLQRTRVPMEVLVIEHVEKPSEN